MAQHCAKVVTRCREATENEDGKLDLSSCDMASISPAIYELLSSTTITTVNLSNNLLTKLPAKIPVKFSLITTIDLSNNKMSTLPDELSSCESLQVLNISFNSFTSLPTIITSIKNLAEVDVNSNAITSVDPTVMDMIPSLDNLTLEKNPLDDDIHDKLAEFSNVKLSAKGWKPPPPQTNTDPPSTSQREPQPPPNLPRINCGPPPPPPPPPPPQPANV